MLARGRTKPGKGQDLAHGLQFAHPYLRLSPHNVWTKVLSFSNNYAHHNFLSTYIPYFMSLLHHVHTHLVLHFCSYNVNTMDCDLPLLNSRFQVPRAVPWCTSQPLGPGCLCSSGPLSALLVSFLHCPFSPPITRVLAPPNRWQLPFPGSAPWPIALPQLWILNLLSLWLTPACF